MYTVYAHINNINGKIYIGMTSQRTSKRWNNGNGYSKNEYFYRAIKKYGWDGFEHQVVASNLTKEEAVNFEIILIKNLNADNPKFGYNITSGGYYYGRHTESSKLKMSKTKKENYTRSSSPTATKVICDNKLYDCIADCADYYSINHKDMRSWLYGARPMPDNFILLGLRYAEKPTNIKRAKNLKNMGGIKVIYNEKTYESIKDLGEHIGCSKSMISAWLTGRRPMPKEYFDMGLRIFNGDNSKIRVTTIKKKCKVICDGVIYNTIKECADFYNINHNTMICWVNNTRKMPQKFKDLGLNKI